MIIQERDMILLLELVDDLLRLNEAIKNLGGLGYQERFQKLDNVYEILKNNSVFVECEDDEEIRRFYEIVDNVSEFTTERMKILLRKEIN